MIPVGTLCYVVRSGARPDLIGMIVTVAVHGVHPKCRCVNCSAKVTVCQVEDRRAKRFCASTWSCLAPIVPPGEPTDTVRDRELEVV